MSSESPQTWRATILAIEDDPKQLRLYTKSLGAYRVLSVASGTEAMRLMAEEIPDVILLDHQLANGEKGTDFLPFIKSEFAHVPVIMVSGTLDIKGQLNALQGPFSAHYVIEKPVDVELLRATVAHAVDDCGLAETVRCIRSLERAEMLNTKDPERLIAARLGRQLEILKRLRDGPPTNVTQLAIAFKVSRRTIARDIQDLIDRGQLPPSAQNNAE